MSLLLDALKQAAQEKSRKDAQHAKNLLNDEKQQEKDDSSKEVKEHAVDQSIEFSIEDTPLDKDSTKNVKPSHEADKATYPIKEQNTDKTNENTVEESKNIEIWQEDAEAPQSIEPETAVEEIKETKTYVDPKIVEENQKNTIAQLIALKEQEEKSVRFRKLMITAMILIVFGALLFAFYLYTYVKTESALVYHENFDDFITEVKNEKALNQEEVIDVENPQEELLINDQAVNNITTDNALTADDSNTDIAPAVESPELPELASEVELNARENATVTSSSTPSSVLNSTKESTQAPTVSKDVNDRIEENRQTHFDQHIETETHETSSSIQYQEAQSNNIIKSGKKTIDEASEWVNKAYSAYKNGQLDIAETHYQKALSLAPNKRDAILGAAAVAMRQNRHQEALTFYQQLLNRSPKDAYAKAGLLSLQALSINDPQWLSQVSQLLIQYPNSAHLHFLKANAHAANGRWEAAQQSYFEAWSRDITNPDYAYNLAIALDQIGQQITALEYYIKASNLSETYPNNINLQALAKRIDYLKGSQRGNQNGN